MNADLDDALWTLDDDGILDAIGTSVSPGVASAVRTLIAGYAATPGDDRGRELAEQFAVVLRAQPPTPLPGTPIDEVARTLADVALHALAAPAETEAGDVPSRSPQHPDVPGLDAHLAWLDGEHEREQEAEKLEAALNELGSDADWIGRDAGRLTMQERPALAVVLRHARAQLDAWRAPAGTEAGDEGAFTVGQAWLARVLDQVGVMSCQPITLDDVLREVGGAEKRRVEAVRAFDNLGRLREQDHDRALALRDVVLDLAGRLGVPVPGPAVFDSRDRIEALGATLRLAATPLGSEGEAAALSALRLKLDEWLTEDGISPYRRTAFVQVLEWLDAYGTASGDDER